MNDPSESKPMAVMIEELRMIVPRSGEGPACRVIRNREEIVASRRRLETARGWLIAAVALVAVFMAWQGLRADPRVHPLLAIAVIAWMRVDGLPKLAPHVRVRRERREVAG